MNFVLVAKETVDFESVKYNVTSVNQDNIQVLYTTAKRFLAVAKDEGIKVQLYLETYSDNGDYIEYAQYNEAEDEFFALTGKVE